MTIAGELATGVASSLVFESLKRPMDALGAEIRRRDQISRALQDKATAKQVRVDATLDKVSEDLARTIGNAHGALTQGTSIFIRELRRTALPEAIASAALCGAGPEPLRESFHLFYQRFPDLPFSADQLFNAFYEACLARLEAVKDPAFLEIVRAQHADISLKLELVASAVEAALREDYEYPIEVLREARLKLARSIDAEHRYVSVETLRGSKRFKLKNLAIPGRLFELEDRELESARVGEREHSIPYLAFRRQTA